MKHLLFSAFMMGTSGGDPTAITQAWQEFPDEVTCVAARNRIITGDRIIDQGLKRTAVTQHSGSGRSAERREGTCIPAE